MIVIKIVDGVPTETTYSDVKTALDISEITEQALSGSDFAILATVAPPVPGSWQVQEEAAATLIAGVWTQTWVLGDRPLEEVRAEKVAEIIDAYEIRKRTNVTALSNDWRGGMDSTLGIDGAVRIAEQLAQTTVNLVPDNGAIVSVTIAEGKQVAVAIGVAYQVVFATKETLLVAVRDATTNAALLAIQWPV